MPDARTFPSVLLLEESAPDIAEVFDYVALRRDLVRIVSRLCPGWLAGTRDDLVQTALLRVMHVVETKSPSSEGKRTAAASYLYKVAYSVLIDELRRVRRRRESDLDDETAVLTSVGGDPERTTASRQIGRGIRGCLRAMKQERRLAVTLHLQGHSVPEAARILDWAFKRTENLVYRGLADLRACLTAKGMTP